MNWQYPHEMAQDARLGLRLLRRSPLLGLVSLISLALAIGGNTAVFSVANAILLRQLPYPDADSLLTIDEGLLWGAPDVVPVAHYVDWRDRSQALGTVAAYDHAPVTVTGADGPERVTAIFASTSLLPMLGCAPLLGRNFTSAEEKKGTEAVAILSHDIWKRRFGGDSSVIGRYVAIDDQSTRIIGVLPPQFRFFIRGDLWLPLAIDPGKLRQRDQWLLYVLGRLRTGIERQQAQAELDVIRKASEKDVPPPPDSRDRVRVWALHDRLVGGRRTLLILLSGAASLLLLIACANVGNLMLARGIARRKELNTRAALGASPTRLLRQLTNEGVVLGVLAGAGGVLVGWGLTRALAALSPPQTFGQMESIATLGMDWRVFVYATVVSIGSSLVFGLVPAVRFCRTQLPADALRTGTGGGVAPGRRMRQVFLVSQVALSVVLLISAGLLIRSFEKLLRQNLGIRGDGLLTFRMTLPRPRYQDAALRVQFQQRLLERLAALPGVESVSSGDHLPLTGFQLLVNVSAAQDGTEASSFTPLGLVSPDYFKTLGIRLLAGRMFDAADRQDRPRVLILSQSMARRLFPRQDALGREVVIPIRQPFPPKEGAPPPRVVGIVSDVTNEALNKEARPAMYAPYQQIPLGDLVIALRSRGEPRSLIAAARREVLAVDPDEAIYDMLTMEERLSGSLSDRRFTLLVMGGFALLALVLSATGVYGVIAQLVSQRTHEIGVRMAVGARPRDVLRLFLREGMTLVAYGVAFGIGAALGAVRLIKSELFGIGSLDPLSFVVPVGFLTVAALAASLVPAMRAARVDIAGTLRCQ
jgi:putative ABC transport system permease protein